MQPFLPGHAAAFAPPPFYFQQPIMSNSHANPFQFGFGLQGAQTNNTAAYDQASQTTIRSPNPSSTSKQGLSAQSSTTLEDLRQQLKEIAGLENTRAEIVKQAVTEKPRNHSAQKVQKLKPHMRVLPLKESNGIRFYPVIDPLDRGLRYVMCGHCCAQRLYQSLDGIKRHLRQCDGFLESCKKKNVAALLGQDSFHDLSSGGDEDFCLLNTSTDSSLTTYPQSTESRNADYLSNNWIENNPLSQEDTTNALENLKFGEMSLDALSSVSTAESTHVVGPSQNFLLGNISSASQHGWVTKKHSSNNHVENDQEQSTSPAAISMVKESETGINQKNAFSKDCVHFDKRSCNSNSYSTENKANSIYSEPSDFLEFIKTGETDAERLVLNSVHRNSVVCPQDFPAPELSQNDEKETNRPQNDVDIFVSDETIRQKNSRLEEQGKDLDVWLSHVQTNISTKYDLSHGTVSSSLNTDGSVVQNVPKIISSRLADASAIDIDEYQNLIEAPLVENNLKDPSFSEQQKVELTDQTRIEVTVPCKSSWMSVKSSTTELPSVSRQGTVLGIADAQEIDFLRSLAKSFTEHKRVQGIVQLLFNENISRVIESVVSHDKLRKLIDATISKTLDAFLLSDCIGSHPLKKKSVNQNLYNNKTVSSNVMVDQFNIDYHRNHCIHIRDAAVQVSFCQDNDTQASKNELKTPKKPRQNTTRRRGSLCNGSIRKALLDGSKELKVRRKGLMEIEKTPPDPKHKGLKEYPKKKKKNPESHSSFSLINNSPNSCQKDSFTDLLPTNSDLKKSILSSRHLKIFKRREFPLDCNCVKCFSVRSMNDGDEAEFLLCEACGRVYHRDCQEPPYNCIPENDWICSECGMKGYTLNAEYQPGELVWTWSANELWPALILFCRNENEEDIIHKVHKYKNFNQDSSNDSMTCKISVNTDTLSSSMVYLVSYFGAPELDLCFSNILKTWDDGWKLWINLSEAARKCCRRRLEGVCAALQFRQLGSIDLTLLPGIPLTMDRHELYCILYKRYQSDKTRRFIHPFDNSLSKIRKKRKNCTSKQNYELSKAALPLSNRGKNKRRSIISSNNGDKQCKQGDVQLVTTTDFFNKRGRKFSRSTKKKHVQQHHSHSHLLKLKHSNTNNLSPIIHPNTYTYKKLNINSNNSSSGNTNFVKNNNKDDEIHQQHLLSSSNMCNPSNNTNHSLSLLQIALPKKLSRNNDDDDDDTAYIEDIYVNAAQENACRFTSDDEVSQQTATRNNHEALKKKMQSKDIIALDKAFDNKCEEPKNVFQQQQQQQQRSFGLLKKRRHNLNSNRGSEVNKQQTYKQSQGKNKFKNATLNLPKSIASNKKRITSYIESSSPQKKSDQQCNFIHRIKTRASQEYELKERIIQNPVLAVGQRISILSTLDHCWRQGVISRYDKETSLHTVVYDIGTVTTIELPTCQWKLSSC